MTGFKFFLLGAATVIIANAVSNVAPISGLSTVPKMGASAVIGGGVALVLHKLVIK